MANIGKLLQSRPYRGFHMGLPGSGKSGALAALANVGYKLRVLDFGGNPESIAYYVSPEAVPNVDVVTLKDPLRNGDKYLEPVGIPEAFNNAARMLMEWKYKDEDGAEINLGKSKEWGLDTIVVVDDTSGLAKAILRRAIKMNNKTPSNMTSAVWGHAVTDFNNFLEILTGEDKHHHVIVNMHQQMLGPSDFLAQGDADPVKEKKLEAIKNDQIPTRWYPIAVTKPQAQNVHGALPILLHFEKTERLGKAVRIIETQSGPLMDVKIPIPGLKKEYGIEDGLVKIFEAAGYKAPGFGK